MLVLVPTSIIYLLDYFMVSGLHSGFLIGLFLHHVTRREWNKKLILFPAPTTFKEFQLRLCLGSSVAKNTSCSTWPSLSSPMSSVVQNPYMGRTPTARVSSSAGVRRAESLMLHRSVWICIMRRLKVSQRCDS